MQNEIAELLVATRDIGLTPTFVSAEVRVGGSERMVTYTVGVSTPAGWGNVAKIDGGGELEARAAAGRIVVR